MNRETIARMPPLTYRYQEKRFSLGKKTSWAPI